MIVARSVLRVPLSALAMAYPPTNRVSARETDYLLACRFLISRRESRCLSWRPVGKKEEEEEKNLLSPVSPSSLQNGSSLSLLDWFRSWIGDVRDVCTTSNSLLHLRLVRISRGINFASPRETAPMRKWVLCMASSLDWNRVCIGRGPISNKDEAVLILWRQMTR